VIVDATVLMTSSGKENAGVKAEVNYLGKGLQFEGVTQSGQIQKIDDPTETGEPVGPSPMELVLQAAAGCTAMDVVLILNKMRRTISDLRIWVEADRREEYPRIFTGIHLIFQLTSPDVTEGELEKAIKLSQEKYCSVAGMLRPVVNMTYALELKRP
jgi:putative redox protein